MTPTLPFSREVTFQTKALWYGADFGTRAVRGFKKVEDQRRVTVEKRRKGVVENREKKELEERICGPGIGGKKLMKGLCKGKRVAEMFGEL
ncbi:hypothetical protein AAG906_022339 [Vitis piasezkii]